MVTLIVVPGKAAWRKYSQELGKRLNVKKLVIEKPFSVKGAYSLIKALRNKNITYHLPFHSLSGYAIFSEVPFIVTIHDLYHHLFPSPASFKGKAFTKIGEKLALKRAKHFITISKNTKSDVVKFLKIPEDKITIVPEGIDHDLYYPRGKSMFDFKYILYVGSERPNKNFAGLLKAFQLVKRNKGFKSIKLVKVGDLPREEKYRKNSLKMIDELSLREEVIFTGWVREESLPIYYSGAECFVFPSFYEGFGLPPLEAMACGCPVITSNTSALPEVVGEAGIKVDPYNIDSLAEAIIEVLTDERLREEMREKGLERASQFSWGKTAEETLKVYEKVEKEIR